jgi:predicted SAM-dependent methyltransferase
MEGRFNLRARVPVIIKNQYRKLRWAVNRPPIPVLHEGEINLHLGCGVVNHPKFINIDLVPNSHVHYLRPIDDLSLFSDASVDLIYASHCLEHFPYTKVLQVLSEWNRVLKKGRILRLSVPDFDNIIETYRLSGNKIESVLSAIVGGQNYKYNYHYVVFNKDYLTDLLLRAGFCQVREWCPGSSDLKSFDDWSNKFFTINDRSIPISLNLEAIK